MKERNKSNMKQLMIDQAQIGILITEISRNGFFHEKHIPWSLGDANEVVMLVHLAQAQQTILKRLKNYIHGSKVSRDKDEKEKVKESLVQQYSDSRTDAERAADAKIKSTTTTGSGVYTPPPSRAARVQAVRNLKHVAAYISNQKESVQLHAVADWLQVGAGGAKRGGKIDNEQANC